MNTNVLYFSKRYKGGTTMWDAKRLLRCGERLYRAGKYALCTLLIGLLVLLVLALVSLFPF